jgi:hypothetical protein
LNEPLFEVLRKLLLEHPLTSEMPFKVFSLRRFVLKDIALFLAFLQEFPQINCIVVPNDTLSALLTTTFKEKNLTYKVEINPD